MRDWEVERGQGVCAVTGRALREGEEFYAALFEEGEGFRRLDFSAEAWTGPPEGAFCTFRSRVPARQARRRMFIDDEGLLAFFLRLVGEQEPVRVQFRFVLALILMRKRLLKYESSRTRGGVETWTMIAPKDQSRHAVVNPGLTDDQIEGVSRELTAILHGDTTALLETLDSAPSEEATDEVA